MLIVHVVGGLGNQLYCYAMYLMLQKRGLNVKLDIRDYLEGARNPEWRRLELLQCVKVQPEIASEEECYAVLDNKQSFWSKVRRKLFGCTTVLLEEKQEYDQDMFLKTTGYLDGYWNCDGYYQNDYELLQDAICFPKSKNPANEELADRLLSENAVAVHLRRTDYLNPSCIDRYRDICTKEYYQKAISYVKQLDPTAKFYIFSDDKVFAKEYFGDEDGFSFVDWNQDEDSMFDCMLMSKCKYHICANSTFSMWGARLSTREGKVMIRPLKNDNYESFTIEQRHLLWENWILIDEQGNLV